MTRPTPLVCVGNSIPTNFTHLKREKGKEGKEKRGQRGTCNAIWKSN